MLRVLAGGLRQAAKVQTPSLPGQAQAARGVRDVLADVRGGAPMTDPPCMNRAGLIGFAHVLRIANPEYKTNIQLRVEILYRLGHVA
jgi:hypothetical protein